MQTLSLLSFAFAFSFEELFIPSLGSQLQIVVLCLILSIVGLFAVCYLLWSRE